jgi:CubicO group peptidase (beta-lactamase class C family)
MSLVERGQITLNTLVCSVLPEFAGEGREEVRLRHLLTHTSGLIYESPVMEQRLKNQTPLDALIAEALQAPLRFKPGSNVAYADYNTLVAGHMVEVATGTPLSELVRTLVLEPMNLRDTFFPTPPQQQARVARVRSVLAEGSAGAMYNSPYALGLAHPAFAVTATARDLLHFAWHFAAGGPRIHSEATVRAMTVNQAGVVCGVHPSMKGYDHTAPMPWGLGFALQTEWVPALLCELASFKTFGHGGASGCQLLIDPEQEVMLAVLSNTHLNEGREAWYGRLQSIINVAFAALSRA